MALSLGLKVSCHTSFALGERIVRLRPLGWFYTRSMPITRLDPDVRPETRTGSTDDGDDLSHYARREEIMKANVLGGKIKALCGWEFEPVRDPSRFPVCPRCKELVAMAEDFG